jgi:hypothetical protein
VLNWIATEVYGLLGEEFAPILFGHADERIGAPVFRVARPQQDRHNC